MRCLRILEDLEFRMEEGFDVRYAGPVLDYVNGKILQGTWDDYNELYHLCRFVEVTKATTGCWMHTHVLVKSCRQIGVVLVIGGSIDNLENRYAVEEASGSLLLKYFHVSEKGRGYGTQWLRSAVIPYYRERAYHTVYVSSSHEASWPFYQRFGREIGRYEQSSDNRLYVRSGKCFAISLSSDQVGHP